MESFLQLVLVRHGNTFEKNEVPVQVGAKTDLPLTDRGREQAKEIAAWCRRKNVHPVCVYSGGLKRQTEAAKIIAGELAVKSIESNFAALDEIDYGPWEGLSAPEIEERWPEEYRDWEEAGRWPSFFGGGISERRDQLAAWLDGLRKFYNPGDTVLAVSSNGVIRLFYSFIQPQWEKIITERRAKELKVRTGHYCLLRLYPARLEIVEWNRSPQ